MENLKPITLGRLIDAVTKAGVIWEGHNEPKAVYFDFCGFVPAGIDSWRGDYAQLSIKRSTTREYGCATADSFLAMLKECIGYTFTGYKGGQYTASRETEIWVDENGACTHTAVVGIKDVHYGIVLVTANIEE